MDATLAWTIVGSVAGVAAAVTGVVFGVLQLRSKHSGGDAGEVEADGHSIKNREKTSTILPPPVKRLPGTVRGRQDLVALLVALSENPDGKVHVLAGLGGSGKSTVALAMAKLAREAGRRAWWVTATDRPSVTALLLGLAQHLGAFTVDIEAARLGEVNASDVLWQRLDEVAPGWILVLDNVDDLRALAVGDRLPSDGSGWLRPTRAGLVLVTSRITDAKGWGSVAAVHEVGSLGAEAGGRVLADLAPNAGDTPAARTLALRLGGLPLALHQAGTYLAWEFATVRTFTSYGQALSTRFEELLGRGDGDRARVTATWELSLDALAANGRPQALMLLRVLSCFASAVPVPPVLLDASVLADSCGGVAGVEEGLSGLLAVGLIETRQPAAQDGQPPVLVHPLVAETMRYQAADSLVDSFAVAVDLIAAATGRLDQVESSDLATWEVLRSHVRALQDLNVEAPDTVLARLAASDQRIATAMADERVRAIRHWQEQGLLDPEQVRLLTMRIVQNLIGGDERSA